MRAYWFDNLPGDQRQPHDSGKAVSTARLARLGIKYYYFPVDSSSSSSSISSSSSSSSTYDTSKTTSPAAPSAFSSPSSDASDSSHAFQASNNDDDNGNRNDNDKHNNTPTSVDALARSRGYTNRDQVTISPAALGDAYEAKVRSFFDEHLHEDEEIRYILDGSGYFDVRAGHGGAGHGSAGAGDEGVVGGGGEGEGGGGGKEKETDKGEEEKEEGWIRIRLERGDLMIMPAGIYHRFTTDEANYTKAMRLFQDEPKWTPLSKSAQTDANAHRLRYLAQRSEAKLS